MNASERYDSLFTYWGEYYGVDPKLLKAQVRAESNFNPDAISWVGAKGLAQFMDRTFLEWRDGTTGIQEEPPSHRYDPFNPEDSIRAQAAMMAWLLRAFKQEIRLALAGFNWGIGNVTRLGWHRAPLETRRYVDTIMKALSV